jgi:hypothetical protein
MLDRLSRSPEDRISLHELVDDLDGPNEMAKARSAVRGDAVRGRQHRRHNEAGHACDSQRTTPVGGQQSAVTQLLNRRRQRLVGQLQS